MNKTNLILAAALCAGSLTLCGYETYKEACKAGSKAYAAKDYAKMQAAYAEAKTLAQSDSQEWSAIFMETRACRDTKKYDEAIAILDKFLAKKPASDCKGSALFVKGLVQMAQEKNADALKQFEAALAIPAFTGYQRDQAICQTIGIYYGMKQYDKCEAACKKQLAFPKTSYTVEAYYNLGLCAFAKGKYAEAEKQYLAALKASKPNGYYVSLANYQLAETSLKLNKKADAIKYYEATIKAAPKSWRAGASAQQLKKLKK